MNADTRTIRDDLSRHLQVEVFKVLDRHLRLAATALEPGDLTVLALELGVSVGKSLAATVATTAHDGNERVVFETMLDRIAHFLRADIDRDLAAILARRAQAGAA